MFLFHEVVHSVQGLSLLTCTQRRWEESMAACPVHPIFQDSLLDRCNQSHCFGVGASHIPLLPEVWYTVGLMHHFCFYHTLSEPSASEKKDGKGKSKMTDLQKYLILKWCGIYFLYCVLLNCLRSTLVNRNLKAKLKKGILSLAEWEFWL